MTSNVWILGESLLGCQSGTFMRWRAQGKDLTMSAQGCVAVALCLKFGFYTNLAVVRLAKNELRSKLMKHNATVPSPFHSPLHSFSLSPSAFFSLLFFNYSLGFLFLLYGLLNSWLKAVRHGNTFAHCVLPFICRWGGIPEWATGSLGTVSAALTGTLLMVSWPFRYSNMLIPAQIWLKWKQSPTTSQESARKDEES